jgi:hypothetical protein
MRHSFLNQGENIMKINSLLRVGLVIFAFLFSTIALADYKFQAGDIEKGATWTISESTGVASYFADGKSGTFMFVCLLNGEPDRYCLNNQVVARLTPGKNFSNSQNPFAVVLTQGLNGPFKWTLTDTGENNGNIKVFYSCGDNVTVQCKGLKV